MDKRTCSATNKRGERCRARAVERGLCAAHSGKVDMQAIGRRGGSRSPLTRLRQAADDDLREQARDVLARALRGEDVPKSALDSARSLFSYRADSPPAPDPKLGEYAGPLTKGGRQPTSLADVVLFALSAGYGTDPELLAACRELVAAVEEGAAVSVESRSSS